MSTHPAPDPTLEDNASCDEIELTIAANDRDGTGRDVARRLLPSAARQTVGPFVYLEQFGPIELSPGAVSGIDTLAHPHIGITAITYLFEGRLCHVDSLGSSVVVEPGGATFLTAGRGVVHLERENDADKASARRLFGIQIWAALPQTHETLAPHFSHHGVDELPRIVGEGTRIRLILGSFADEVSPVEFPHPAVLAEVMLAPGAILPLEDDWDDRAILIVSGTIDIAGESFTAGRLLILRPGHRISILALSNARLILLGGEPMDGTRHVWWNFVASSRERIEQAKDDWQNGRFPSLAGDDSEPARLPDD